MNTPTPPPSQDTAPITRAVIAAAGQGTRLRPLTTWLPKEMLPLGDRPLLALVADELRQAGITHALFVISERKPLIREYFGDVYAGQTNDGLPPLHCEYVLQTHQQGSGHAVLCAQTWADNQPFVVAFGDSLIARSNLPSPTPHEEKSLTPLQRLIAAHTQTDALASVLVEKVALERVSRYGIVRLAAPTPSTALPPTEQTGDAFAFAEIVEKPAPEDAPSRWAVSARWIFAPAIFDALGQGLRDVRGEINLPDAINLLARQLGAFARFQAVPLRLHEARRDLGDLSSFYAEFVRVALSDAAHGDQARALARALLEAPNTFVNPEEDVTKR